MQKTLSILMSCLLFSSVLSAQNLDRGNFIVGATVGFSTANSKVKISSTDINETGDGPSATQINFAPNFGYFLVTNFAVGIGMDYTYNAVQEPDKDEVNDSDLLFGPFFRYYLPFGNNAALFIQTDFGFGSSSDQQLIGGQTRSIKSNIFAVGVGPGITIFSNDRVAIEAVSKYNYARSQFDTSEGNVATNTETKTNQIDLSIGMQFYF